MPLLVIAATHFQLKIGTMTDGRETVPWSSKEPGGTVPVTFPI